MSVIATKSGDTRSLVFAETPRTVLAHAAHVHGITVERLLSKNRCKSVVVARRFAAERLESLFGFSSVQIGRWLQRSQTTILHLLNRTGRQRRKTLTAPKE